jgi:VIT1/CCC1 family predicted Fe2+/Mn2+ transporter
VESHASRRTAAWQAPALRAQPREVRTELPGDGPPGWWGRLPLLAAITGGVIAGGACVLAVSWLAVVIVASGAQETEGALPWAIGCAGAALGAFAAALGALLSPRRRTLLLGVAGFLIALLATGVIALAMSGASEEVKVPAAEPDRLLERGEG